MAMMRMRMYVEADHRPLEVAVFLEEVARGRCSKVKKILAEGVVNADLRYGSDNFSVLEMAASKGHLKVVSALLDHGVNVDSVGRGRRTALHNVVVHGWNAKLVKLLVDAGADIEAEAARGKTALHLAAQDPDTGDIVGILLEHGAAKDVVDDAGDSSLHLAAESGNLAATRALLAAGADPTLRNGGCCTLDLAARYGQVEIIRELARHGVDLDAACSRGRTALHVAAESNKAGSVNALVEAGASVNLETAADRGITPLHCAIACFGIDTMRALLRHGARVLAQPTRASEGDGVSHRRESPLHCAAAQAGRKGASEMVDLLLRWGADESELDDNGKTPAEAMLNQYATACLPDAVRVRTLLANAPADRTWRRRGLLLLCLARKRTPTLMGGSCLAEGKGEGPEDEASAKDGGRGGTGRTVRSWSAAEMKVTSRLGKHKRTPSKAGGRRARSGRGRGGGTGGSKGGGRAGGGPRGRGGWTPENGGGIDGVVAMLSEFEEGLFRKIIGYL